MPLYAAAAAAHERFVASAATIAAEAGAEAVAREMEFHGKHCALCGHWHLHPTHPLRL